MDAKEQNKESQKLLTAMYKNVRVATQSIENILSSTKLNDITIELSRQVAQYYTFEKEITMLANALDYNLKDNSFIQKTQVWISVKLNLLSSTCTQHIAEMLLVGTMMGIIDLVKATTNFDDADEEIVSLANNLEQFERENIEVLFKFLKIKPETRSKNSDKPQDNIGKEIKKA